MKFFADTMLGRLARWMRIMGYDVEYEPSIDDDEIIRRALEEGRIILTRDTLLARRRAIRGRFVFIKGDHLREQLHQIVERFGMEEERFLTRCLRCNLLLVDVVKEAVRDSVPPYVYTTQERFSACPGCGRIYWAGTHRDHMMRELSLLFDEGRGD